MRISLHVLELLFVYVCVAGVPFTRCSIDHAFDHSRHIQMWNTQCLGGNTLPTWEIHINLPDNTVYKDAFQKKLECVFSRVDAIRKLQVWGSGSSGESYESKSAQLGWCLYVLNLLNKVGKTICYLYITDIFDFPESCDVLAQYINSRESEKPFEIPVSNLYLHRIEPSSFLSFLFESVSIQINGVLSVQSCSSIDFSSIPPCHVWCLSYIYLSYIKNLTIFKSMGMHTEPEHAKYGQSALPALRSAVCLY
ncbi:hypothetical protein NECID01_1482 [Nematocida sp. AWRm77]|nr:hypothetical protein NECID01_1482 [Nematocida sp. AWRm77]